MYGDESSGTELLTLSWIRASHDGRHFFFPFEKEESSRL